VVSLLDTARLMSLGRVEAFVALNSFFNASNREAGQTAEVRRFILNNRNIQELRSWSLISQYHRAYRHRAAGDSVVLRATRSGGGGWTTSSSVETTSRTLRCSSRLVITGLESEAGWV